MSLTLTLLLSLLPQDRPPEPPAVVVLESGEELAGTIVAETSGYLEVRIGGDTVIGLQKSQVREVRRAPSPAAGSAPAAEAAATGLALAGSDLWFALHDGEGRVVGTLHSSLVQAEGGELRFAEEWDFAIEHGRTQLTRLEVLSAGGAPLRCFYHERTVRPGERLPRDERLVRGEFRDGQLEIVRTDDRGSQRRSYPADAAVGLPLALAEHFRQRPGDFGFRAERVVFDTASEELRRMAVAAGHRRRVELDGAPTEVREVAIEHGGRRCCEWLDGNGSTVRREVNGAVLVAARAPQEMALAMAGTAAKAFPPAVLREAEGRFSLWLPNPIWRFDAPQIAGQVSARAALYGANLTVLELDQLEPGAAVTTAGDAVERWLGLACTGWKVLAKEFVPVQGRLGLKIDGTHVRSDDDRRVRWDTSVVVVQAPDGGWLAASLTAPAAVHEELTADFERMVATLELHPQAVAAEASRRRPRVLPR